MRTLEEETFRFRNLEDGRAKFTPESTAKVSWFAAAQACADRAARAGFVASMMFLAAAAIYALSLSGAAAPVVAEAVAIVDRAAIDAGYRLDDISISGARNTPQAVLLEALRFPYPNSSLFYDTLGARDRLLNVGWIESADVRRILPARLEVVLSERIPFARWADAENKVQTIDRAGHILGPVEDGQFATLPLFSGQGASAEAGAFSDVVSDHPGVARRIERTELVAERFWTVTLDNGVALKLPRKVNAVVFERIESLLANPKIADMAVQTIDLRLPHRTILQLREPTVANRDSAIALLTSITGQTLPAPRRGKSL